MKQPSVIFFMLLMLSLSGFSQVAVNATGSEPDASAMLDVSSTDKGVLIPRLTTTQRTGISDPANGLIVFDTDTGSFWYFDESSTVWVEFTSGALQIDDLSDAKALYSNIFLGNNSGLSNTGIYNTAVGSGALKVNTSGSHNTAIGYNSLLGNTTGVLNTIVGCNSGGMNNASYNTVLGANSFYHNVDGSNSVAVGVNALFQNTTGYSNVAIGNQTLKENTIGKCNVAVGAIAGYGFSGVSVNGCVYLGYAAGSQNIENNKLYIENSDTELPLIGGDFLANHVDINGTIKISGGSPGTGKVLTSNADGLASWQEIPGGVSAINDLSDGKTSSYSLFLGSGAGETFPTSASLKNNTGIGQEALNNLDETGMGNTVLGSISMFSLETGSYNTAVGKGTIYFNETGSKNTAIGFEAGRGSNNNSFSGCVFIGYQAGLDNTDDNRLYIDNSSSSDPLIGGDFNTNQVDINGTIKITGGSPGNGKVLTSNAVGVASWETSTAYASEIDDLDDASYNGSDLFLGNGAGDENTGSNNNVAVGSEALNVNTDSPYNTAIGNKTLKFNLGQRNTAIGYFSLHGNFSGSFNTALGYRTGYDNSIGDYNTFLGYNARMNNTDLKSNSTAIGNNAVISASNQVRIGNSSVTSIGGQVGWSTLSDGRFKEDVKENVAGLDFILDLRPVSYTVNKEAFKNFVGSDYQSETKSTTQRECGFVAQEVEELIKSMGVEFNGVDTPESGEDYYGIRYGQFVVPLVKAVQEQQDIIQEQQDQIDALSAEIEAIKAVLNE